MSHPGNRRTGLAITSWDAWLKEMYPAQTIEQMAMKPSPLYEMLTKHVNYTSPRYKKED